MVVFGISGLVYGLREINLIHIPASAVDLSTVANKLHSILGAIRSFFA